MQCPECGAIYTENDLFCGECGGVLPTTPEGGEVTVPAPAVQPNTDAVVQPAAAPSDYVSRAQITFILGIISCGLALVSCVPVIGYLSCSGPVLGIIAIVLGLATKRDIDALGGSAEDRNKAHRGMILGIVGIVLYVVMMSVLLFLGIGLAVWSEI